MSTAGQSRGCTPSAGSAAAESGNDAAGVGVK